MRPQQWVWQALLRPERWPLPMESPRSGRPLPGQVLPQSCSGSPHTDIYLCILCASVHITSNRQLRWVQCPKHKKSVHKVFRCTMTSWTSDWSARALYCSTGQSQIIPYIEAFTVFLQATRFFAAASRLVLGGLFFRSGLNLGPAPP